MISASHIHRALERDDSHRLIDLLAQNGLPMPLPLRLMLQEARPGLAALALRRAMQLERSPSAASRAQLLKLLDCRTTCGGFGPPDADHAQPLATCLMVAAMGTYLHRLPDPAALLTVASDGPDRATNGSEPDGNIVREAFVFTMERMPGLQDADGLLYPAGSRSDVERLAGSALALFVLADQPQALARLDIDAMLSRLERADGAPLGPLLAMVKTALGRQEISAPPRTVWPCAA